MSLKQMTWDEFEAVLAAKLPTFKRREIQAVLAQNGLDSLQNRRHILAQAGCGTGKSFIAAFAALMMSLKTGRPSGIATATKALQDQYSEKDLPFLASILDGLKYAVLKGRGNYVCMAKVDEMESGLKTRVLAKTDEEGFSGELLDLGFDVEPKLAVSTSEECPGKKECPFGDVCFAERAKDRAKESHIVVANHAVLAADLMVREMQEEIGIPEDKTVAILPHLGTIIIDEAHEFQDSVTNALGGEITAGSYGRLAKEIENWFNDHSVTAEMKSATTEIFNVVARVLANREDKRNTTLAMTDDTLSQLAQPIVHLSEALAKISNQMRQVQIHGNDKQIAQRKRLLKRIDNASLKIKRVILADEESLVRWLEVADGKRGDVIGYAPLTVDGFLNKMLWERMPAMLMSATLSMGNDFSFIKEQLGIDECDSFDAGSPFDFTTQALTFIPNLAVPSGPSLNQWRAESLATVKELVRASQGSALLLFTSRTEMEHAYDAIAPMVRKMGHTALKQGDAPNKVLAKKFDSDKHSVLFALKSFMTGVDFQGDTLRLVWLNKLPFPVPTDVVLSARVALQDKRAKKFNDKGFNKITVPLMALTLLQAFGRGIRTVNDHCVIGIGDSRLYGKNAKSYGARMVAALPNAPITADLDRAMTFLSERA